MKGETDALDCLVSKQLLNPKNFSGAMRGESYVVRI